MALIGILGTPFNTVTEQPFYYNKVIYTRKGFVDALQALGHQVIIIPADKPENAETYVKMVDKILLTGGADVSPLLYGEEPHQLLQTTDPARDTFEFAAIEAALKHKKALFGVCRGFQILNVYFGGSLYQDLSLANTTVKHMQSPTPQEFVTHHVTVKSDQHLLDFLPENYVVNSFHHQAVKKLAPNLTAIAHATDGLVEAFEDQENRVLAVQWHPEVTFENNKLDHKIFKIFAEKL